MSNISEAIVNISDFPSPRETILYPGSLFITPPPKKMGHWITSLIGFGVWIIGVLSQDDVQQPFSMESGSHSNECGVIGLIFPGGVMPYSIYYSVAHKVDNYNTWSEETLVIGNRTLYAFFVDPNIAKYTDAIRFRAQDSTGVEDTTWVLIRERVEGTCEPNTSIPIMTDVTSFPDENEPITTKDAIPLILIPTTLTDVTSHATATPESEQISTRRPQASGTIDSPAPETGTRDSDGQSSHTRNSLSRMTSGANNSNGEILTAYPGGGGNNGASNEHGSTQDSDREDRNRVSDSFNSHAPTIPNDVNNTSGPKAFRLSNQAAGVIGATVGIFFSLLIAFAWYRFRRAGTGFLKLKA